MAWVLTSKFLGRVVKRSFLWIVDFCGPSQTFSDKLKDVPLCQDNVTAVMGSRRCREVFLVYAFTVAKHDSDKLHVVMDFRILNYCSRFTCISFTC